MFEVLGFMTLQTLNFEDKFNISVGRELFFIMTKKEVYREHHYLTKVKMDLARFYWNNSDYIKTFNLIIMYDIVFTFVLKNYNLDILSKSELQQQYQIDEYINNILNDYKFKNLNYLLFNDLCNDPIKSISRVMSNFNKSRDLVMSLDKNNFDNLSDYINHMSMVTKYFIPLEQNIKSHEDYIKEYTKNKFFVVGDITITDYDIYLLKGLIFNKNPNIDLIYKNIERFSEAVKNSFLFGISKSTGHENVIEVMEFIRNFDVSTFKTDILDFYETKAMRLRYL